MHRRSATRLLLRACRHPPPARALLWLGQPHRAPILAMSSPSLSLTPSLSPSPSLALALALALALTLTLALAL